MSKADQLFTEAETRITRARDGILRQEKIVDRMKAAGENNMDPEFTLTSLKETLVIFEDRLRDLRCRARLHDVRHSR